MSGHKMKPIWYFVGLILLIMGALICFSGIYQVIEPPAIRTVLAETHPNIWWGAVMAAFGGIMLLRNRNQSQ